MCVFVGILSVCSCLSSCHFSGSVKPNIIESRCALSRTTHYGLNEIKMCCLPSGWDMEASRKWSWSFQFFGLWTPCLFLSSGLHMAAVTGRPFSLQNRRAEWKQLHPGPSGIHAENETIKCLRTEDRFLNVWKLRCVHRRVLSALLDSLMQNLFFFYFGGGLLWGSGVWSLCWEINWLK